MREYRSTVVEQEIAGEFYTWADDPAETAVVVVDNVV
jgi:hypothetical protein